MQELGSWPVNYTLLSHSNLTVISENISPPSRNDIEQGQRFISFFCDFVTFNDISAKMELRDGAQSTKLQILPAAFFQQRCVSDCLMWAGNNNFLMHKGNVLIAYETKGPWLQKVWVESVQQTRTFFLVQKKIVRTCSHKQFEFILNISLRNPQFTIFSNNVG